MIIINIFSVVIIFLHYAYSNSLHINAFKEVSRKAECIIVNGDKSNNKVNVPTIKLKGDWLKKYGFNCNDNLELLCENGSIRIKKHSNNCN